VWALIAFNMDTTVTSEAQRFGSGDYAVDVPSVTVNNLGLMETRRNNLMFAGLTILAGVVLIGFGSLSPKPATTDITLKACPFCAEPIRPTAIKCRFCSSDLPENFGAATAVEISATTSDRIRSQMAQIELGNASIETYMDVVSSLGGSLIPKGFIGDMHYLVELGGATSRIDRFGDLRQWFLDNVAPRLSA
jgi:hypothetical protein